MVRKQPKKILRKVQTGFTLIELLLVIAILSIIVSLGILQYRRSFLANRVEKTAIGMQHVLEAALSFYVDKNAWPDALACGDTPTATDFIQDYLPNGETKSPMGASYCWQDTGAGTQPQQHRLFWVALKVPGEADSARATANQIAARLPNAITTSEPTSDEQPAPSCTDDACYVRAEVTVPGSGSPSGGSNIVAAGSCQPGKTIHAGTANCQDVSTSNQQLYHITFKACPASTQAQLTVSPNFVQMPSSKLDFYLSNLSAMQINTCTTQPDDRGQEACQAQVIAQTCKPNRHGYCQQTDVKQLGGASGASYLVMCQPVNKRDL